jgi:biopolymer transport protein ExbB
MKKLLSLLLILGFLAFSTSICYAQEQNEEGQDEVVANGDESEDAENQDAATDEELQEEDNEEEAVAAAPQKEEGHQVLKKKFIEGGPAFMALPLLCLILGLAIALERIISLFFLSINTKKFVNDIDSALASGGIESAKNIARDTRGPVASIYYQGLDRASQGNIDAVEKAVLSYGSVQMGQMEKGLVWLSLFIALAPMLGFMGTVIGMIGAFDAIEQAGDISPAVVASGIKVALLTTVAGLIVAIILQLFYNYLVSKIDGMVNTMEDASISLIDSLIKNNAVKA